MRTAHQTYCLANHPECHSANHALRNFMSSTAMSPDFSTLSSELSSLDLSGDSKNMSNQQFSGDSFNVSEISPDPRQPSTPSSSSYNRNSVQSSSSSRSNQNIMVSIMIISNDLIGCVIGRCGAKIREIRNASKAQIKISNSEDGCRERKITITGDPCQVAAAKYLINNSVELHKHLLALNMALNPTPIGHSISSYSSPSSSSPNNCFYNKGGQGGGDSISSPYQHQHHRQHQLTNPILSKTLASLLFHASPLFQRNEALFDKSFLINSISPDVSLLTETFEKAVAMRKQNDGI